MAERMTEDSLNALVDLEMRNAQGYFGGKLAEQRRKATFYYLGEPQEDLSPPEVDGRSKVVVPYVRNTIEAMLPQLMEKFTGGDDVVEFEPTKPGDEEQAKADQATDFTNYVFWKKNPGHKIAEIWMRDALQYKNGIIKVWWDARVEETKEEYRALDQIELAEIMDDEEIEVTEQKTYPDEDDIKARKEATEQVQQQLAQLEQQAHQLAQTIQMVPGQPNPQAQQMMQQKQGLESHLQAIDSAPPVMLYDITCKRSKKGGKLAIENVPPEEFMISRKAKDIATAPFCGHMRPYTMSDLLSMGYKQSQLNMIGGEDSANAFNSERIERDTFDDDMGYTNDDTPSSDESQKRILVVEAYVRVDYDGDGIAELRKITKAGNTILDNEEVDLAPFVDIVCVRRPHRFFGLSIMDLGQETQFTSTSIVRSLLDNMYLEVNGRYFAVENQVNLDDLMTSRPGGTVRIKQPGAVGRLDQGMGNSQAGTKMLEYMTEFGEAATGWTRNSQGNASGPLMSGTATGANIVANKDDMRLDLIARNFAEGFRELFRQMLKLFCQHQDKKTEIRLSGQWVDIDPRSWKNQFDININVGFGAGSKDQKVQHLMAVIAQQEKVFPLGVANPENIYNTSADLAKLTGQKNPDKYFTDPAKAGPQPPKPNPEMIKGQVQTQIAQANGQVTMQIEQAKLQANMQLEQQKANLQAQVDQSAQQAQERQTTVQQQNDLQIAQQKAQLDQQTEFARIQHERDLEMARLTAHAIEGDKDRANKVLIAQIAAGTAVQTAAIAAENRADETVAA
jgi:hypothetical protein